MALTAAQQANAKIIFDVGVRMGMDAQTIAAAIATAMMESGLVNNPGGDRDSIGLFQQRPSQGWGTPQQISDPSYAARKFYEAYARAEGGSVVEKIANTQRPAAQHRDKYADHFVAAGDVFSQLSGQPAPPLHMARPTGRSGQPQTGNLPPAAIATGSNPATPPPQGGTGRSEVTVDPAGNLVVNEDKLPPNATDAEIEAFIIRNYPDASAWLKGNQELRDVLFTSARLDEDELELEARLRRTTYYQTHGPDSRAFDLLLADDPVAAGNLISNAMNVVADLFTRNGLPLDNTKVGEVAKKAIRAGWINTFGQVANPAKLNDFVAYATRVEGQPLSGEPAAQADAFIATAKQWGVPLSRKSAEDWALRVLEGTASPDSFMAEITSQARSLWQNDPDVLRAIDSGRSPEQFFDSHRETIANLLELDPDSVDLFGDPRYLAVTQHWDGEKRRAMTLGEVQQWTRNDERYKTTRSAQEQAAGFTMLLKREFEGV